MKRTSAAVATIVAILAAWVPPDIGPLPHIHDFRYQEIFTPPNEPEVGIYITATAYCSCPICCGKWAGSPTASGKWPHEGRTIAADTSIFQLGTCLDIPEWGLRVVEDTGSAIKGFRIDIYFEDHTVARHFGVQHLLIGFC